MSWASWAEFFAMGGYGLYVWGSYAGTTALIVMEVVVLGLRRRAITRELAGLVTGHGP